MTKVHHHQTELPGKYLDWLAYYADALKIFKENNVTPSEETEINFFYDEGYPGAHTRHLYKTPFWLIKSRAFDYVLSKLPDVTDMQGFLLNASHIELPTSNDIYEFINVLRRLKKPM